MDSGSDFMEKLNKHRPRFGERDVLPFDYEPENTTIRVYKRGRQPRRSSASLKAYGNLRNVLRTRMIHVDTKRTTATAYAAASIVSPLMK
jgi:hypothetical protein